VSTLATGQGEASMASARPVGLGALAALGVAGTGAWVAAVVLARTGTNPLYAYNGAFAVAFVLYLAAAALVVAGRLPARRGTLVLILALAVLPRLILLASTPALSDDLYRYIWDGRVSAAGIDPYRYAPDDPALIPLRDRLWTPINQKGQHTPYPPFAQLVFAATYQLAPESAKAQQIVAVLADLLAIGALLWLLTRLGLPRERVLLYAWSPTPILHFAHSAHNDAIMIAAFVAALALAVGSSGGTTARRIGSGVLLAVAVLTKLVPLLLAAPLLRRWRVPGLLAFAFALLLGVAPFLGSGAAALAGLGTEAGESSFNDSVHLVLVRALARVMAAPELATSLLTALVLGVAALALLWRGGDDLAMVRGCGALLALAILFNAVVEPWYLAWLLPFVALFLRQGRGAFPFALTPFLGWLWISGAIQLTDLTYLQPANVRAWPVIRAVEYGPLLAILAKAAFDLARERLKHRSMAIR
jgi:alpha-1,6-mannosyltransferase